MSDTLNIFGVEYTNVAGLIATTPNETDLTYIRPQGTKSISANGTGIDVSTYASVDVAVPSGTPTIQSLSVTPSESEQTFNSSSVDGYKPITVGAISSTYVGTGITRRSSTDLTASGATVTVPSGYYSAQASKTVTTMELPSTLAIAPTTGFTKVLTIGRQTSAKFINIREGYNSTPSYYEISAVPDGTAGTPTATKGTVSNHSVSVTPSVTNTTGYITGSTKTGTAVTVSASELVSGSETKTENGTYDVTNLAELVVNVPIGPTINNQDKSVTPSESQQSITADSGYTGLGTVIVGAISSTYVGSDITRRSSSDMIGRWTENAFEVVAPSGFYEAETVKTSSCRTLSNPSISIDSNGLITSSLSLAQGHYLAQTATATEQLTLHDSDDLTVSGATVTAPAGYYSAAASKTIDNAGLVFSSITSHTPNIGNTGGTLTLFVNEANIVTGSGSSSGYISVSSNSSTTIGTAGVYLYSDIPYNQNNSVLIVSGATVTVPAGYYAIQVTKSVASGSATAPASISGTAASVSTGNGTLTLTKTVSVTPSVTAGYVSSGTAGNSSVSLTASVTIDPTPTASGATVTIPAGYYTEATSKAVTTMILPTSAASSATSGYTKKATISRSTSTQYINIAPGYNSAGGYYEISAVANGSATGPSSLSGSSATISTGTNTLTLTKTGVTTTPTVTAGYVSSAIASTATVTLTASVITKAAATITPTTTNQTIAAGTYLTGAQTIAGDADLVGSNILSTANIFGVQGTVDFVDVYIRSAAPTSSVGNDGDIYIQE